MQYSVPFLNILHVYISPFDKQLRGGVSTIVSAPGLRYDCLVILSSDGPGILTHGDHRFHIGSI